MANNDDIKQAAFRLFANKGYDCTSMQDIAQAVGLKKQSLYSHFTCKQELYTQILREQSRIIMAQLQLCVDRLENEPTDVLFKGLFTCLIEVFSCRERLLLWKRGFMVHGDSDTPALTAQPNWYFDKNLWDRLYNIVKGKHEKLSSHEAFRSFLLSYFLSIQGYFDWMIGIGHNDAMAESLWKNIWFGIYEFTD